MAKKKGLDRRRSYYLILDCETATLPYANKFTAPEQKKKISISKPLIYDLGWVIVDKKGNIYKRRNFLITEIFSAPSIFNTAYYKEKRPIYLEKLKNKEIVLATWEEATAKLVEDMDQVKGVGAYNAMFDFKKAIPFTETYISHLYQPDFYLWEKYQNYLCDKIIEGTHQPHSPSFEANLFSFRGKDYPLFDIWGLACKFLINTGEYKLACLKNNWKTSTNMYFSTSAENVFKFCANNLFFQEEHTALADAEIETILFCKSIARNKGKIEFGIIFFPFRLLGKIENFDIVSWKGKG